MRRSKFSHIKKPWMSHLFHSRFTERAGDAAIIVNKDIAIEPFSVVSDPNGRYDPNLDRPSTKQSGLSKSANMLKFHADQLGLSNPWRTMHNHTKAFSFFSHVHTSYSRIDFYLLDNRLLDNVQSRQSTTA